MVTLSIASIFIHCTMVKIWFDLGQFRIDLWKIQNRLFNITQPQQGGEVISEYF